MIKAIILILFFWGTLATNAQNWISQYVSIEYNNMLRYHPDEQGNIIPDFSRVGYHQGVTPPEPPFTISIEPQEGDNTPQIQQAINLLSERPIDTNGFRGCLLLKKGIYHLSDQITISASGIIIRGEGCDENGTVLIANAPKQYTLIKVTGSGTRSEISGSRTNINMPFVPVGAKKIKVDRAYIYKPGDNVVIYRPGTAQWISDLKMDQIDERTDGTIIEQWKPSSYSFHFERKIEKINGDTLILDVPIVMHIDSKYGGGQVYKYQFEGRISECGIENMLLKSYYAHDTDEKHAWTAIAFEKAINCWTRNITAQHFAYSAIHIKSTARNISVLNCKCIEAKSLITGGRRYSFNCDGQMNLFKNCFASEGRHDFVTGARVCGPNVFTQCTAINAHSDIGPHHRWAMGTLYDLVTTDGQINVQDRGNYGTGHGWAGANQILWNCTAKEICLQNPWVTSKNYAIGCTGKKWDGRFPDRPSGIWEGLNTPGLQPQSLYEAQMNQKHQLSTSIELIKKPANRKEINYKAKIQDGKIYITPEPTQPFNIEIFNLNGSLILKKLLSKSGTISTLPLIANNTYILRISSNQTTQVQKIFYP